MNLCPFFDLKIESFSDAEIWKCLNDYHIRTVAINQNFDATIAEDVKKKKGEKKDLIVPSPPNITIPEEFKNKIVVLKRLTVTVADGNVFFKIVQSPNFKLYDIVAVVPTNNQALQFCCACNDIDLISFEPENKPAWMMTRKLFSIALQKNIYFEIQYFSVICDSTSRKNAIQVANNYHTIGRSKNIIITSGTDDSKLLRSPYDVINFCFLLGLNDKEAKKAITTNPKQMLARAVSRRQKKSVLNIELVKSNSCEEH